MRGGKAIVAVVFFAMLSSSAGCSRHYFRKRADVEVEQILRDKDRYDAWKIEQFNVYPDSRSRFADPTTPDRPPMPPDDPAARVLAPNPQKPPHKYGVARVEGTGYLELLKNWDVNNRESLAAAARDAEVPVQTEIHRDPKDQVDLPPPRRVEGCVEPRPYLLKLDQAVELGILNSREFQTRREDLYLAALPVTLERFSFAAQFFATELAVRERAGRESSVGEQNRWRLESTAGFSKLFSTGALLLFQYANRTVINLQGSATPRVTSFSTLNLDLVQPLLQGGGKAVTLEPLTQVERNLLYEIRDFARFRKEFFQYVAGGGDLDPVLIPPAGFGAASLIPGNVKVSSSNPVRPQLTGRNASRIDLSDAPTPISEGFLPSVFRQALVGINQRNVTRLDGVLNLFKAYEEGGRVSSLQVGQAQLQILQSQSDLLAAERDARDSLDRFKLQIGVPVDLPLELDTGTVRPILTQYDHYEELFNQFNTLLARVETFDFRERAGELRCTLVALLTNTPLVRATRNFREQFPTRWQAWSRERLDDKALTAKLLAMRSERLTILERKDELEGKTQKLPTIDAERLRRIELDLPLGELEQTLRRYESQPWRNPINPRVQTEEHASRFRDVRNAFSEVLGEASNERLEMLRPLWPKLPPIVVCGLDLIESDLDASYATATRVALENRLDLMNARAHVVDNWRQIAVNANSLLGVFNVGYHMDSQTPPNEAKPLAFSGSRTRHQLFLNLELPLVRVSERNAYRASLIAYQRARRVLIAVEDNIANTVRSEVRGLQVLAKNYKIQQQSVELAYLQVESSLETFKAPPTPGSADTAASAAALVQQLLGAYGRLPSEQTKLLKTWIDYQTARQQLFLDLELLPLDFRGVWIDDTLQEPAPAVRLLFGDS